MWGVDSFEGLPIEAKEKVPAFWAKGKYRAVAPHKGLERDIGRQNLRWVKGFYNDSLQDSIVAERGMQPARYIDIDCDLYSSAHDAYAEGFEPMTGSLWLNYL